jgi:anti-sigma regulatory factor (Ser/Thr protein kinase)
MMQAVRTSETLVNLYKYTALHIRRKPSSYRRENLKSDLVVRREMWDTGCSMLVFRMNSSAQFAYQSAGHLRWWGLLFCIVK